jgi:salicylate hydroxylase
VSRTLRIAIVGGGIGGLTAACALRERGFEVDVYEKSAELKEVGAGLQLGPNAVKVLNALGFSKPLYEFSYDAKEFFSLNWDDGAIRAKEVLGAEQKFGAKYLMAHRADLYQLMVDRVSNSRVNLGETCTECINTKDGAVARFASGREVEADVVIGADGIHSKVREILFGSDKPRYTGQIGWRGMIPIEEAPEFFGPDKVSPRKDYLGFLGPRGHVIMYPIRAGKVLNFFAGYFVDQWAEESWTVPSSIEEMKETFAGWNEGLLDLMGRFDTVYKWGLYDRDPIAEWTRGRIALLGDAAHPMMPTLAQGAAICIEDAYAFARHLDAGRADPTAALKAYERERQPRASKVVLQARQQYLNNKMNPSPPPISREWIFVHDATTGSDWSPAQAHA